MRWGDGYRHPHTQTYTWFSEKRERHQYSKYIDTGGGREGGRVVVFFVTGFFFFTASLVDWLPQQVLILRL